jgi:peptidoglycan hydrolase-like protein with peptidoglycan-binding domain
VIHRVLPFLAAAAIMGLIGGARDSSAADTKAPAKKAAAVSTPQKKTAASTSGKTTSTAKKTVSAPKKAATASSKKTGSTASKSSSAAKHRSTAGKKRAARPSAPRGQQEPTPERNKEIQQALIDRGYLTPPPTGVWGPESVAALRRFQQEQNLNATGKLDALTLIALGLGPKRSVTAQVRPDNEDRSSEGNQRP